MIGDRLSADNVKGGEINASGDIVGKFRETSTGPFHGYVATRKTE